MKLDQFETFMIGLMAGFGIGGAILAATVEIIAQSRFERTAIDAGVGEYDRVTGEFKWRSEEEVDHNM